MTHPPQAIQWVGRVTGNKVFLRSGLSHLVVRMSRKHSWYAYALMGTVNRRGYGGQQKDTINFVTLADCVPRFDVH